jgi:hypothetical protein
MKRQRTKDAGDALFAGYRDELTLGAEGRARTLRKLQECMARGELPAREIRVEPPRVARVRPAALSNAGKLLLGSTLAVTLGVVLWNVPDGSQPTAAGLERVAQPAAEIPQQGAHLAATPITAAPESDQLSAAKPSARIVERVRRTASRPSSMGEGAPLSAAPAARGAVSQPQSAEPGALAAGTVEPTPQLTAAAAKHTQQADRAGAERAPRTGAEPPASETLPRELQLLQSAQLALRAGDTRRALAALAEHKWTFPRGQLAEARDVARILALCHAGEEAQSQRDAERFLQRYPSSPFALRVRAGCQAIEATDGLAKP